LGGARDVLGHPAEGARVVHPGGRRGSRSGELPCFSSKQVGGQCCCRPLRQSG
jgi:hypothetical protein